MVCEILEANGDTIRYRTSFKSGVVFESLWSPENPTIDYGEPFGQGLLVRTWVNGDELSSDKAQGVHDRDRCICLVLGQIYGDDFSGYEHNYRFEDGYVMPDEG